MIIDERTYDVQPGKMGSYLQLHLAHALPVMRLYLGEPHGYYVTESGELNQFVHLWRYESLADREQRRRALYLDPQWLAYKARMADLGLVTRQRNRLLRALEVPPPASAP